MRWSIRSKCICRSCSRCSATFRWCRWRSAMRSAEEVAQVLDALWGGAETLIVISSDLSHYLTYADAQARRPADRAGDPRHARNHSTTSRRAAGRRSTGCCRLRAGGASRPNCSICAIPAIPRATATASSAMARSRSTNETRQRLRRGRAAACMERSAASFPPCGRDVLLPLARAAIATTRGCRRTPAKDALARAARRDRSSRCKTRRAARLHRHARSAPRAAART